MSKSARYETFKQGVDIFRALSSLPDRADKLDLIIAHHQSKIREYEKQKRETIACIAPVKKSWSDLLASNPLFKRPVKQASKISESVAPLNEDIDAILSALKIDFKLKGQAAHEATSDDALSTSNATLSDGDNADAAPKPALKSEVFTARNPIDPAKIAHVGRPKKIPGAYIHLPEGLTVPPRPSGIYDYKPEMFDDIWKRAAVLGLTDAMSGQSPRSYKSRQQVMVSGYVAGYNWGVETSAEEILLKENLNKNGTAHAS